MPELTVAICTHSPDAGVFGRVLTALAAQSLDPSRWELLIVDNASPLPVARLVATAIPGLPPPRVIVEPVPGIGAARRRALREAAAPLICFFDDDTLPEPGYLADGLAKARTWPQLGCWGGQLHPEWGAPPPPWLGVHRRLLAIHEVTHDLWSNERYRFEALPPTAGMFLRAEVGAEWLRQVAADPRREWLGSHGRDPRRGEDTDLAFCAHDLGLGTGIFCDIALTHIIPASRLTLESIADLLHGARKSMYVLFALRGQNSFPKPKPRLVRLAEAIARWRLPGPQRALATAEVTAIAAARAALAELGPPPSAKPNPKAMQ